MVAATRHDSQLLTTGERGASPAHRPLVLCVDDQDLVLRLLASHLGTSYRVHGTTDSNDALAFVKRERPDLVLLDARMPGVDGYEICARLKRAKIDVPVIFVTALDDERDRAKAFAAGAVDYLVKPIVKARLREIVERHVAAGLRWNALAVGAAPGGAGFAEFADFKRHLAGQRGIGENHPSLQLLSPADLYAACAPLGISAREMAQHAAEFMRVPYLDVVNTADLVLGVLPSRFCEANRVLPIRDTAGEVVYLVANPFDLELREVLSRTKSGAPVRIQLVDPEQIARVFADPAATGEAAVRPRPTGVTTLDEPPALIVVRRSGGDATADDVGDLTTQASRAPIVKLMNDVLAAAIRERATDVHIEPRENSVGIRYRVDGMLEERPSLPKNVHAAITSRLKIMAGMDIAQRRVPQDGRLRVTVMGEEVDLRVSTIPSRHGEKAVIRVLDRKVVSLTFEALGFDELAQRRLAETIKKPHGLLLVTGPTGSGKTTTLYTALQALNEPHRNLVTVEDPIEYEVFRAVQMQVNPQIGLTFASALRSILRQDPDVIMVGEIRDAETLDIAMKASLTGHLVLSTLHTNDAASTVARLTQMAEAYLVASTLDLIVAQRLVRKLCTHCKRPGSEHAAGVRASYEPVGCPQCRGSGYRGRTPVAEVLAVDEGMRRLIRSSADTAALETYAIEHGMQTLRQSALRLVQEGVTSLAEIARVVG